MTKYLKFIIIFVCTSAQFIFAQAVAVDSLQRLLPKQKEDSNKVNLLYKIGTLHNDNSSKERFTYFVSALNLAKQIEFEQGIIRISRTLINNLTYRGLYEVALEYYYDYMEYAKKNNLQAEIKSHYKIFAILLSNQGKYSESLIYNFKALNYYDSTNNETQFATALNNICLLHLKFNYLDSAYLYGLRASQVFEKNNKQSELANIILGLAEIKLKKGEISIAKEKAYTSLAIYNAIGYSSVGPANCHEILADIYYAEQKYDSAISNYNTAIHLLKDYSFFESNKNCFLKLSKSYFAIGKAREAYLNHVTYAAYNDSVASFQFKAKALEMDVKYSISKKESELREKELKIINQNKQRNFLILGILGVLVLLGLSYRSYQQKKKANDKITEQKKLVEEKQKEIVDSIKYAQRIQQSLLPTDKYIDKHTKA